MLSIFLLASLSIANAENENRPLRPTTHPADPALSQGAVDNFQRLYCDPDQIASQIKPTVAAEGTESLVLPNQFNGWVDVSVGENRIGRLGPLTTGVINNVPAGEYAVSFSVERMQYVAKKSISTQILDTPLSPGNVEASIASEADYKKPGLEDNRKYETGKLTPYQMPKSSISPTPEPAVEE
jgi:hypothetical protein